jgi:hypothetical protein
VGRDRNGLRIHLFWQRDQTPEKWLPSLISTTRSTLQNGSAACGAAFQPSAKPSVQDRTVDEDTMTYRKTVQIPVTNAVVKRVEVLADEEGQEFEEMLRILLEDALALRETVKDHKQLM